MAVTLKQIRKLGGAARMRSLTPKQRVALARKAALARWAKKTTKGKSCK